MTKDIIFDTSQNNKGSSFFYMKKPSSKHSHCYVDKNDDNGENPSCVNCNRDDDMTLEGDAGYMIDVQNPLEN